MAFKKPLVMGPTGFPQQIQSGDTMLVDMAVTDTRSLSNAEAAVTATAGMAVYISGSGAYKRAQANAMATADVIGLAYDPATVAAATGNVATGGVLSIATTLWDAVTGQTGGLTPGVPYFLDPANPGKITVTPPSAVGQVVMRVGKALSTTDMEVLPSQPILL